MWDDVYASPFSTSSYCNGYLQNSGLKITKLYLDTCADGFLNCTSQLAAGELWFYDRDKTEDNAPLSHNQSRHSCFGFDQILISALSTEGAVNENDSTRTNLCIVFYPGTCTTLPRNLSILECDVCSQLSHENLQDKWSISNEPLNRTINNSQKSYGYKERISLEQLRAGVLITTTAPGAVVRITPMQNKLIPQLKIKTPKNQLLSLQEASALFSQDEPFGDKTLSTKHQTMLQIKPELGFGTFILKSEEHSSNDADAYLINVYDKFSPTYLDVQTDSIHYQYGDKLTAKITLVDYIDHDIYDINASLIGPGGQYVPLKLSKVKKTSLKPLQY
ncbi:Uncharacterised protein [Legionella quateirensis]|uniref:Uncharacterized protein n=1 Tax=Legionella quateirensis TaxID=45072 RepID=A0A378P989_9GAMM|nr:Uncharacterised protein [Legionella quateirensis]